MMQYVYILQSLKYPDKYYVGCTNDVANRLQKHNAGQTEFSVTTFFNVWSMETGRPDWFRRQGEGIRL